MYWYNLAAKWTAEHYQLWEKFWINLIPHSYKNNILTKLLLVLSSLHSIHSKGPLITSQREVSCGSTQAKHSSQGWCNGVSRVGLGLTGKSRTSKKLDSNTLHVYTQRFLLLWVSCLMVYLTDCSDVKSVWLVIEIQNLGEKFAVSSFRWQIRLKLQYSICSSHRIKLNQVVLKAASLCPE